MIGLLLACATECPEGSSLGADGLCYLDAADTGEPPAAADPCAVEEPGGGAVLGQQSCTDGVCEVPAGDFVMGSANPVHPDQCPPRVVTLSAFAIDETEVTAARWKSCVSAGGCQEPPECPSEAEYTELGQLPVVCVGWQEAADFCAWAGGRLPTEAEWEKAARGEDGALWAWGSQPPSCERANFRYISAYCQGGIMDVGSYSDDTRSAFGLLDVVGNAWEWTADGYDADYYTEAPDVDPPGPTSCNIELEREPGECSHRVIRGGGFNTTQDTTLGSTRSFSPPDFWDNNIGFRCAYDR